METRGTINVPLAIFWEEPGVKRSHDQLILASPTDPTAWTQGMDIAMRLWLVGKVTTHALLGEQVVILDQQGDWVKVAAVDQPTNIDHRGYPGWIPAHQISESQTYLADLAAHPQVVIKSSQATLYLQPNRLAAMGQLSYQTKLPLLQVRGTDCLVCLPDGRSAYLPQETLTLFAPESAPRDLLTEARSFLGLPYIWGGTSSFGFDCSGFVFRLFQAQGISIPRDADEQALQGASVPREKLAPGDLLFFADQSGQGAIHHVGLYLGDELMIHAPNSKSVIREESLSADGYSGEYWGAKRYL